MKVQRHVDMAHKCLEAAQESEAAGNLGMALIDIRQAIECLASAIVDLNTVEVDGDRIARVVRRRSEG